MSKQIVIAEQHRIAAVYAQDQIQEIIVATGSHQVGDIYLGTVENILPGIDAAFVNIGDSDKNGFMHVSDLGPLKLKRTSSSITELLAPQQKVLVQIMKEPTGNKGPRLTGKVTLPGRYLVLMPYGRGVNLSRRIRNESERNRLRALGILIKPAGMGLLVRTEAEGVSEEAIIEDLELLQKRWDAIQQEAMSTRPPSLLNRDDDFIQKVLRDVYSDDVNRIVADSESGFARTKKHLSNWNGGRIPANILVDYHRESTPILEYFRVNAAIREALKPRVDLPSGGYIIIEPTEALTVIDVNSGSFTRSATARETVLWTNCEAAVEIARQLKLRNIAGVIVVDFIDMDSRRDQMQVLEQFGKALRSDKSRPQISQLSELGLVELTRKRQGQNIYELFGRPCPSCGGLGHLANLPGESLESVGTVGSPTPRTGGYSSPAQSFSSKPSARGRGDSGGFSTPSELQELDLLNHPSYQEKNGRGNRRRRRRGSDSGSRDGRASFSSRSERGSDRNGDDRRRRSSRVDERIERERLERENASEPKSSPESSGRSKRSRGGRRKPEVPPEIIAVEMPPEEQRVYAMMGVSPLVYSEQTVENPQNTIVSVVLPGEADAFLAKANATATKTSNAETAPSEGDSAKSNGDSDSTSYDEQEKAPTVRRRRRSSRSRSDSRETAKKTEGSDKPQLKSDSANADPSDRTQQADSSVDSKQETAAESQSESKKKVVRRRRRRSSASGD